MWLLLGAATAFHPLVGGWSGLVCGGIWLFDARRELMLLPTLPGFAAGGLLALVGIVPALALTWNVPADVVNESNQHLCVRAVAASLGAARAAAGGSHAAICRPCCTSWAVVGFVAGVAGGWLNGRKTNSAAHLRDALSLGARCFWQCIGLAIELVFYNRPDVAAKLLRYYWFRLTDFAAAMAVALQLTALVAIGVQQRRGWATPLLVVALVLAGGYLSITAWSRVQNPIAARGCKGRQLRRLGRSLRLGRREHAARRAVHHAAAEPIIQMAHRPAGGCESQGHSAGCAAVSSSGIAA